MLRSLRRRQSLAALTAFTLLATGCSAGGSDGKSADTTAAPAEETTTTTEVPARLAKADEAGSWTVFVYLAADNNLEPQGLADVSEMVQTEGTEFVVLLDRAAGYSEDDLGSLGNFDDSVLLHIQDGDVEVLDQPGEINMGDPEVLQDFIGTNVPAYPNDHQALVIWDHGGSWKGAAWDEGSEDDNLTAPEMTSSIEAGLADAGTEAFDLLGFDACLMATYEITSQLAPFAAYQLASEETEPGAGWDWTAFTADEAGLATQDLAQNVIDAYTEFHLADDETNTTLSLIDLTKLDVLDAAADEVAAAMNGDARDAVGRVGYGRTNTVGFGKDPQPENDYFLVDLGDLATQLAGVDGMEDAAASLADAVEAVVVTSSAGPVAARATGIAAYFPSAETYHQPEYDDLALAPSWQAVLESYYDAADDVAEADLPVYLDEDRFIEDDEVTEDADALVISSPVGEGTGGNITESLLHWGEVDIEDSDYVTWYGQRNAEVDGDVVSADYDWRYLTITDGQDTSLAYSSLHVSPEGAVDKITIPIEFVRGDTTAEGRLELTVDGGSITNETFYVETGEGISALEPVTGDGFYPLLERQNLVDSTSEWIHSSEVPLYASTEDAELNYRYDKIPSAEAILVGLGFSDVMGAEDWVYYGTASP